MTTLPIINVNRALMTEQQATDLVNDHLAKGDVVLCYVSNDSYSHCAGYSEDIRPIMNRYISQGETRYEVLDDDHDYCYVYPIAILN